jgi:hypothetical protein
MVLSCYVAFAALGWFLNGFGSILPDLEDDIGSRASLYPLLPGAVLLVSGIIVVRRHRTAEPRARYERGVAAGSIALAGAVVVMGVTRWQLVSLLGALAAAISAAFLIRLLPAVLATIRAADTERAMMRSNAYSSVAAIVAPLSIGASIALRGGWLPGMVIPLAIAAGVVVLTAHPSPADGARPHHEEHDAGAVPPLATWWREWAVLTMSIVVEFCFVYFAATYLHDELGLSTAASAAGAAAWGIGMSLGRFAVSTWPPPRTVLPSVVVIAIGFVLLWCVSVPAVAIAGIGIAGVGASPLYPSRMTALLDRFPLSPEQGSARGSLASGVALVSAPALMAGLRGLSDVRTAYLAVPVLLAVLAVVARPAPSAASSAGAVAET